MATYNGEKYLKEQIDSLLSQTYTDWTLYIHDDGSTDGTKNILSSYHQEYDKIQVLDYPSCHGAKENFFSLLNAVDADYYFFSDQDEMIIICTYIPQTIFFK